MIEEYLQNSWWISYEKRKAAIQLQNDIRALTQIDSVIDVICNSQLTIAEKDIKSNKNYFADSRLQNTSSNIQTMAAALWVQTNTVEENLVPKRFN
jgi:hypothetical protein